MPGGGRTHRRLGSRDGGPPTAARGGRPLHLAYGSAPRPPPRNPRCRYVADVANTLHVGRQRRPAEPPPWTCLTPDKPLHITAFPPGAKFARSEVSAGGVVSR